MSSTVDPSPSPPGRHTSPTRAQRQPKAKLQDTMPRLDSGTSTSALPAPPGVSVSGTAKPHPTPNASAQQRQPQRQPQPLQRRRAGRSSSLSDTDHESVDDFATERDRLLATHGVVTTAHDDNDEHTPLLAEHAGTQSVSAAQRAAHRQARRAGMATEGRTSLRTEFHTPLPWRALVLTVFLFCFGSIALSTSLYLFLGYGHAKDPDKWQPLAVLGSLCMIPGAFYLWHFLMVALGVPGWSYDDIPEL